MAKEILNDYGPDAASPQRPRASNGGIMPEKDVLGYSPPQGPTSIGNAAVGLGGKVYPGGSQSAAVRGGESGMPGIGGERKKAGSQR